ncbi:lytic transglycosylase domain-containing protein [Rufibacter glacialis]|uniref:Lytic transglycosylase domain-containing protein n=1 Tax=Rufibacter glacialis TaxID=1259555 RepID=A0A5M8Q9B9_9BACT|nr:lytic transglycosylase domain-containing protein [Rufibacter glacialis]KAA6432499.1 lytic transglycosylase domain-containing protein [Rufibacter glacialis]GGK79196.1 murein transglycosylase [Rufibacter glacialis]
MTHNIWKYLGTLGLVGLTLNLCSQQPLQQSAAGPDAPFASGRLIKAPTLPTAMSFAGEPVPLDVPDVAERLDRELLVNSYLQATTLLGLKRMQRYMPEIERLLKENDIPADFVYLSLAESLFSQVTSPAGASGFWQLMPDTARGYGLQVNGEVDERFHVEKSTLAACRYLKSAKKKFGSWTNAAAAYNRGVGGIDRALAQQKVSSYYDLYLTDETSRYMFRILALKEVLGNPQKYGFDLPQEQGYEALPTRSLTVTSSIPDLAQFAVDQGTNYKTLRLYNPWIKNYKLTVAPGKQYVLQLPK